MPRLLRPGSTAEAEVEACADVEGETLAQILVKIKDADDTKPKKSVLSKFKEGIEVLTKDNTTKLITIAGFCRKFADMILGSYAPFFFMLKYPA